MSAICSGNPSVPNAGVPAGMVVDAAFIQSLLPPALSYLYPFIPMMHGLEIGDVGAFCAADPPTLGLPDSDDFINFVLGGPIGAGQVVNEFLEDVAKAYLWYRICHCTVVSTPAAPTPPADPGDLPALNPPTIVSRPLATACATENYASTTFTPNQLGGITFGLQVAGRNVTAARVTITPTLVSGSGGTATFTLRWYNATTTLRSDPFAATLAGGANQTFILPAPPVGSVQAQAVVQMGGSGGTWQFQTRVEFFCDGSVPGGQESACCPPDPVLTALLRRVLGTVELIQRQSAPFSYVPGVTHTALTNQGEIAVSGLIGAKVSITAALPSHVSSEVANPTHLFGAGWIQWGSPDGYSARVWLDQVDTLSFPSAAGAYTVLAYSLPPGIVIAIQELVREP